MPKWHPYLPRTFLFCLSLQAGVVACSVSGLTIMLITALVNIYAPNGERLSVQAVQYILLFLYLFVMFSAFTMAFLAAFWEISKFLKYAACFMLFGLFLYVLYSILSIIPNYNTMINVCPGRRCPDHHWLDSDRWRDIVMEEDKPRRDKPRRTDAPWPKWTTGPTSPENSTNDVNETLQEGTAYILSQNRRRDQLTNLANNLAENWFRLKRSDAKTDSSGVGLQTESDGTRKKTKDDESEQDDEWTSTSLKMEYDDNDEMIKKPIDKGKEEDSRGDAIYIMLSVFYILLFIGFLGYSMLIFLAFSRELDIY